MRREYETLAEIMKAAGYATACYGKWGLGEPKPSLAREGVPNEQGFDDFFGYLNHTHAHNYYPEFLWKNKERVPLRNVVTHVPQPNGPDACGLRLVPERASGHGGDPGLVPIRTHPGR